VWNGYGSVPTWLRQVSPPPLHKTTLTTANTTTIVSAAWKISTWRSQLSWIVDWNFFWLGTRTTPHILDQLQYTPRPSPKSNLLASWELLILTELTDEQIDQEHGRKRHRCRIKAATLLIYITYYVYVQSAGWQDDAYKYKTDNGDALSGGYD